MIIKHKLLISEFKKRIKKYANIMHNLQEPENIKKYIYEWTDHQENGYGEKFVAYILFSPYFYENHRKLLYKEEIITYYEKYKKLTTMLDNNCIGELLITTNDNKHIYCYRGVSSSPTIVSSLFESFLLNYLFGYTDIDPKYEHGEYHNLTKEQKKQLKKEQEDEYKSRRAWWKIMPDEDESSAGMKNTKIKFGKLKIIPNENGKKWPPKALRLKMVIKEKK